MSFAMHFYKYIWLENCRLCTEEKKRVKINATALNFNALREHLKALW